VFLLAAATKSGEVDETHQALARKFNLPLPEIVTAIEALEAPDPISRSTAEDGRRIVRLEEHRSWGWRIVNYGTYRNTRSPEERRAYKTAWESDKRACGQLSTELSTESPRSPHVDIVDRRGPMQKQKADAESREEEEALCAAPPPEAPKAKLKKRKGRQIPLLEIPHELVAIGLDKAAFAARVERCKVAKKAAAWEGELERLVPMIDECGGHVVHEVWLDATNGGWQGCTPQQVRDCARRQGGGNGQGNGGRGRFSEPYCPPPDDQPPWSAEKMTLMEAYSDAINDDDEKARRAIDKKLKAIEKREKAGS